MRKLIVLTLFCLPLFAQGPRGPQNGTPILESNVLQDPSGNCGGADYSRKLTNLLVNPPREWLCVNTLPQVNIYGTWTQSNVGGGGGSGLLAPGTNNVPLFYTNGLTTRAMIISDVLSLAGGTKDATHYLDGTGNFSIPPGSGSAGLASFNGRSASNVVPQSSDYSSFFDATGAAAAAQTAAVAAAATHSDNSSNQSSGTLPAARLPNSGVTAGSYGSATLCPTFTLDATGRVTLAVSQSCAGGGGGGGQVASGAGVPSGSCDPGVNPFIYQDTTSAVSGSNVYVCVAHNTWARLGSYFGPSGFFKPCASSSNGDGCFDVDTNLAEVLNMAQTATALKSFQAGINLLSPNTQPTCVSGLRGEFWYLNNGSSKDGVQVCVFNGTAFAWVALY